MARVLQDVLDEGNANRIGDALKALPAGQAFALVPRHVVVTVSGNVATLPEGAKAAAIVTGFRSAGTALGVLTPMPEGTTLAAGECAVNATGDVAFFAADAVTEAELVYIAVEGEIFEDDLTVATNVGALPSGRRAAVLLSATDTTSGASTALTVLGRSDTNPGATEARISGNGTDMRFGGAVTSARVRYIAQPAVSVGDALLGTINT